MCDKNCSKNRPQNFIIEKQSYLYRTMLQQAVPIDIIRAVSTKIDAIIAMGHFFTVINCVAKPSEFCVSTVFQNYNFSP